MPIRTGQMNPNPGDYDRARLGISEEKLVRLGYAAVGLMFFFAGIQSAAAGILPLPGRFNVGGGYNFFPGSGYVSAGYRMGLFGVDAMLITMGREEPAVRPGPELGLDGVVYVPGLPVPVFAKLGPVAGWGKYGVNAGCGVDVPLVGPFFARLQDTWYYATEDQTGGFESEDLVSLGLHVHFG